MTAAHAPMSLDAHTEAVLRIDLCGAAGTALFHLINGRYEAAESYLRAHVTDPAALARIAEAAGWLQDTAERVGGWEA